MWSALDHPGHHSVVTNCSEEYRVEWAWSIFGECVLDGLQYAGFILGLVSILCWIFVFIPQFIESIKTGRMDEAVSPFFLTSWLIGDLTNLVGCILTHQLGTQIATAYYYIVMDTLICTQYTYYLIRNKRRRKMLAHNGHNGSFVTVHPRPDQNSQVVYCVGGLFLFSYIFSSVQSFGSSETFHTESRSVGRSLLSVSTLSPLTNVTSDECRVWFPNSNDCLFKDQAEVIGYAIGSLSGLFYLGSRLPQIIKNFQRRSVEGLSMIMFILTVLGNTFYGASILMEDIDIVFVVAHMPWLVGSIGTLTFDCILLLQFALYGRNRSDSVLVVDTDETTGLLSSNGSPKVSPSINTNTAIYS